MERRDKFKKISAAAFIIVGLFLIGSFIFALGRNKGLTQPKFQITVLYSDVGGLIEGAPVRLAGVNIGNVDKIAFLEKQINGRRVNVTLNIFKGFRKQLSNKNAVLSIQTEGILGEKYVQINVLDDAGVLDLSQPIMGEDLLDVQEMTEVFARAAESFTKASEELSKIEYQELTDVAKKAAESLAVTSDSVNLLLIELKEMTIKSKRILNRLEKKMIEGDLFSVF